MKNRASLVAFVGTTPNIGTTVAAFAAAYRIAEASSAKVGFLCLNLKSAKLHRYLHAEHAGAVTLDSLRPELTTGSLTEDKLLRSMDRVKGNETLRVLYGNVMRDQAEYYSPADIQHLLDIAVHSFDLVVADVGAYWDNAATICSLRSADSRILVTTPALTHFQEDGQRWIKQLSPMFGIEERAYKAVIIHPPWKYGGYQVKDICKELEVSYMGELKLTDTLMKQLDSGALEDWLADDEHGKQAMEAPAGQLIQQFNLRRRPVMHIQPWYKKLLTHRGGRIS
ncbi:hypothetical protein [Paenibacillus sp. GCM10027626]|uniref:hypothetical protein n=1 Tax=Paenibacillus sp. GCM10027626 TaxID=3273411 RepID=UPI003641FBB0